MLLTGVLWCGAEGCTARMYRHAAASGDRQYIYYECRQCGNRARLDWANMAVDAIITKTQDRPVVDYRLVPGDDHEAEKAAVREALDQLPRLGLDRRAEQAERERLWAEQDRLEVLETVPARYDEAETGEGTYAEVWARLDPAGRSAFLNRGTSVSMPRKSSSGWSVGRASGRGGRTTTASWVSSPRPAAA